MVSLRIEEAQEEFNGFVKNLDSLEMPLSFAFHVFGLDLVRESGIWLVLCLARLNPDSKLTDIESLLLELLGLEGVSRMQDWLLSIFIRF